ncbi:MAG: ABC transporter substrate-binding protein, partial [Nitrospinota bacterium]|nr:ABC transporter substrate-binding protein [Nitrospinota bacterium]
MSKFDFSLKNAPIRIKLTILSMLTTLLALSLASVVIITSRVVMEWTSHEQELAIKAGVIGAGVRAAIIFSDEDHLNRTLAALSVDNSIIAAAVYSSNGSLLASYKRPGEDTSLEPLRAQGAYFHSANLHYYEDIFLDGERVGSIYLRDDMREFFNLVRIYVLVAMLATLVGAAAAYIFWSRAQRLITDPIHSLAGAMLTVSRTQDYAIRVQYPGADEMGTMISGFNQMLGQIEERDRQLEEYSRGLESKVAVATRELRDKNDMLRAELAERLKIESALHRERELFIHGPAVAFKLRAREGWPLEYISPNIAQFGFRPGDIVSRSQKFLDLIHPNDRARFAADVAECLAGQQGSFEGEYRIMEGERTFWLDITAVLVRDQSGALTHLDGYALDITERKLNQEKLHQTMEDLKRFNRLMSGREIRILELKAALNDLMELQGFAPKFKTTMDSEQIPLSQDPTESEPEARWPEIRVNVEAARNNQLEKTVIGINFTHPLCAAPLALARQWGIFARMGLDVSLNRVEPVGIAREFLAAGKTDLAMLPVPEILAIGAGSGGERITVRLFPLSITGAQGLVISNRRSEVKSPKDLKGMILGVPGFDTVNLHLLFHYLASHGLDPFNDLLVRETEPHLMPFYLRKGMVDGVFASEPALGGLIESKEARLFVHSSRIWPGHPCCSLGALESFHTQAPNTTAAIFRAYSEAATQMNQLNEAQARHLADTLAGQEDGPGFDRGVLAQAIQDLRSHSKGGQGRPGPRFVADRNGVGGVWQLMQMQRWGRLGANVEQEKIIKRLWLGAELIGGQITEAQPPPETPAELKAGYARLQRSNLAAAESQPPAMAAEKIMSRVEAVNLLLTEAMGFAPMRPPEVLEEGALGRLVRLAGGVTSVIRALNDSLLERKELMEKRIEERTEELFSSRKIALNMMEDAQEARQKAEDMAEELKQARYSAEIAAQDLKHTLLVSEQLRAETEKAKDMAERLAVEAAQASEAKSEFLANMSHELRTPLNGVIGLTEMLMKSGVTTGQRKKLDMIRFSGQVLLNLVNDILDLARIEAGKMSLSSEEFSLRELVEKTTSQYALAAHEKGLEIVARLDPGLPQKVMGDPVRLNQVLA